MEEIERKFILDRLPPGLEGHPSRPVLQGYLGIDEEIEVRLRLIGGERLLTVKRGTGERREEIEIPLEPGAFERLWKLTEARRIEKRRYLVPLEGGEHAEVDVYGGDLDGLAVAEVEFASEAESRRFRPPDWFGRELTGEDRYSNQQLAIGGLPPDAHPRDNA